MSSCRNSLFFFGIFCMWMFATTHCGPTPQTETPPQETTTDTTPQPDSSVQPEPPADRTASPDQTPSDTAPNEPATPDRSPPESSPDLARDAAPEVRPEPPADTTTAPDQTPPETIADQPIENGACQSAAPKCATGYICRDDVTPNLCHLQCDPSRANACPGGSLCLVLSSGEGICVNGTAVKKGEDCDAQKICDFGLVCVLKAAGSPEGTCYQRCTLDTLSSCPSGNYCFLVHSRNGVCLPGPGGSLDEGNSCKQSNECKPGMVCFTPLNQSSRCARLCDTQHTCTSPLRCVALKDAPADAGACIP